MKNSVEDFKNNKEKLIEKDEVLYNLKNKFNECYNNNSSNKNLIIGFIIIH
jgi:hypothetical protein